MCSGTGGRRRPCCVGRTGVGGVFLCGKSVCVAIAAWVCRWEGKGQRVVGRKLTPLWAPGGGGGWPTRFPCTPAHALAAPSPLLGPPPPSFPILHAPRFQNLYSATHNAEAHPQQSYAPPFPFPVPHPPCTYLSQWALGCAALQDAGANPQQSYAHPFPRSPLPPILHAPACQRGPLAARLCKTQGQTHRQLVPPTPHPPAPGGKYTPLLPYTCCQCTSLLPRHAPHLTSLSARPCIMQGNTRTRPRPPPLSSSFP